MTFPKTVQICGKQYRVSQNKKEWGGSGFTCKQELIVGTANNQTTERKTENFIHEIMELAACERCVRFEATDDEVVFVMNHKQFSSFASDVASAIKPILKE